jgi:molybdopterin-guanine dinucleotide biosynthesis protein
MKPFLIGIGGGSSGAGKTTVACAILKNLKGWGAIKYSKIDLYSSIIDDIQVLSESGKDTRMLLDSGAEKVLWVRSPFAGLGEVLPVALEMLSHLRGVVIEGNSAVKVLKPDIVIFVSGPSGIIKADSEEILEMAGIIIADRELSHHAPRNAKIFRPDNIRECADYLLRFIRIKHT